MLKITSWRMVARGCALGVLAGLLVAAWESDYNGEICEYNQATKHEDCTTYNIAFVALWHVAKVLNDYGIAISAVATVAIAAFTGTLWIATTEQARLTRESIDLARKEFVSAQRPRLRVRNIVANHPIGADHQTPELFTVGTPLHCRFSAANVGGTPATIVEAFAQIFQSPSGLPMQRPYDGVKGNLSSTPVTVAAGESTDFDFTSEAMNDLAQSIGSPNLGHQRLFVMGWLEYRDDIGVVRRTAFCRKFNKHGPWDDGRFYPISDPDYEYEE